MPVIVVGADTPTGRALVDALLPTVAELRAFVSDAETTHSLKSQGVRVAVGDVSDGIRVGDAAIGTFCAILVSEVLGDERERSFAASPEEIVVGWADGLAAAGTRRAIWVGDAVAIGSIRRSVPEVAVVATAGRPSDDVVAEVVALEGAEGI